MPACHLAQGCIRMCWQTCTTIFQVCSSSHVAVLNQCVRSAAPAACQALVMLMVMLRHVLRCCQRTLLLAAGWKVDIDVLGTNNSFATQVRCYATGPTVLSAQHGAALLCWWILLMIFKQVLYQDQFSAQAVKVGSYADAIANGGKSPARLNQTTGTPPRQPPWLTDTPDTIKYMQVGTLLAGAIIFTMPPLSAQPPSSDMSCAQEDT